MKSVKIALIEDDASIVQMYAMAFEAKAGCAVARSTIYRMLERQGWRKIVPRPRHPKADPAAQAAFKKTRKRDPGRS